MRTWEAGQGPGRLGEDLGGWEAGRGAGRLSRGLGGWARTWEAGRGPGSEATALTFLNMKGKRICCYDNGWASNGH